MAATISTETRKKINLLSEYMEQQREDHAEIERIRRFLFLGDVEKNEPSLSERIRNIEKILTNMSRLAWIVTTAVFGAASIYAWEQLIK